MTDYIREEWFNSFPKLLIISYRTYVYVSKISHEIFESALFSFRYLLRNGMQAVAIITISKLRTL